MFDYDERGIPRPHRDVLDLVPPKRAKAQAHSRTSVAAARLMDGERGTRLSRVYTLLLGLLPDGLTDEEGQEYLRWGPNSYRPRRIELTEMRLVEDAGYTRRTHAQRQAVVWRAVPLEDAPR
jgi:hypothetical protein